MNNLVTFKAAGSSEIISAIDQIKRRTDSLTADMISNAKKQSDVARDQLKSVEEQIKALERKNRLETEAARRTAMMQKDQKITGYGQDFTTKYADLDKQFVDKKITRFERSKKIQDITAVRDENVAQAEQGYKDQLKVIREQERQETLQTKLLRDNIDTIKTTSNQQLSQMRRGNTDIIDELDDEEKKRDPQSALANQAAKEKFHDGDKPLTTKDLLGSLLNVSNLQSLMGSVSTMGSSQNGFDLIQPASKGAGNIIGTAVGAIIGSLVEPGGGTIVGAGVGGQIGSMFGDTIGQFEQRRAMSAQDFLGARNRYEAQTQQQIAGVDDTTKMGISASDYLLTLRQIAINTGNAATAAENTNDTLEMEKGLGISKEVSSQMINYFRGTQKDISNLVGGIMAKGKNSIFGGGDYTFLNEFLQKFNQLHAELRGTQEKVATGTTYDILQTFEKIGGQFSLRDTRSMGLINTVNSSLVNPSSDSVNAMSFLALRKSNPGMDISQLLEERQKGLASPAYLQSMLQMVDAMGGDHGMRVMNAAGMLGLGGNLSAARRLYDNRGRVGQMSQNEIEELYSGEFRDKAVSKTTPIEENMAAIKNGLLSTWGDGVDAMVKSFTSAMESALNGAVINLGNNGSITFNNVIKTNPVRSNKAVMQEAYKSQIPQSGLINTQVPDYSGGTLPGFGRK